MMRRIAPFAKPLRRLAVLCGALLAVACAETAPRPAPPSIPPVARLSLPPASPEAPRSKFAQFLLDARRQALAQGITGETFDRATAGIAPIGSIAQMNANQPEFARPVWSYLDSAVSARRIKDAQVMLGRYGAVLGGIERDSGVPREILVAIWGMETDFGHDTGGFNMFAALATLAYDGPRADFARPEFFAALRLYQERHYPLSEMVSSWAGAFGQTQFTPTTFFKYAADGDGDGQIDLWQSAPDALASAARLLSSQGWKPGQPWGYEVKLPKDFPWAQADTDTVKPIADWRQLGVMTVAGKRLTGADDGAIYLPAGSHGPAFLLFGNFSVILKYNNAASYALAVGLLADRMMGGDAVSHAWPRDERPLSRDERMRFQQDLAKLGFDPGTPDGVLGRKTRGALRQYQLQHGLPADGFPTAGVLTAMDRDAR